MSLSLKPKQITKIILVLIILGVILFFLVKLYRPVVQNYLFLKKEQAKLLQQKNDMLSNAEVLKNQIQSSKEDIGMEKSARSELNMKKEGEGVIFVSETTTTKADNKNSSMALWERIKSWFFKKT
jgi:cell division protein FtsB